MKLHFLYKYTSIISKINNKTKKEIFHYIKSFITNRFIFVVVGTHIIKPDNKRKLKYYVMCHLFCSDDEIPIL